MASYLSQAGVSTLWAKIKSWTKDTFTTAKLVLTGYSKSYMGTINATDTINAAISKLETGLDGKAATGHTHTKAQITDFAHDHDDRYYTETEVDSKLAGKAAVSHRHDATQIEVSTSGYDNLDDRLADTPLDGNVVHKTGDETINGNKAFNGIIYTEDITNHDRNAINFHNVKLIGVATPEDNDEAATKGYVDSVISVIDSKADSSTVDALTNRVSALEGTAATGMNFKGTLGTGAAPEISAVPAGHKKGDCYVVSTAGTYAGVQCEVGDMVVCNTTGTAANNAHWTVIQANLSPLTESEINTICV